MTHGRKETEKGYYTRYRLRVLALPTCGHDFVEGANFCHICGKGVVRESFEGAIWKWIGEQDKSSYFYHALIKEEPAKWYEHDQDMLRLYLEFPDALLELQGEGEEAGDLWRTYYLNGRLHSVKGKVVYPEFNPRALRALDKP